MLTKEGLDFLLRITGYFKGRWEDPEWGKRPIDQVLILLSTHTLANGIAEEEARSVVQGTIEKAMINAAQQAIQR